MRMFTAEEQRKPSSCVLGIGVWNGPNLCQFSGSSWGVRSEVPGQNPAGRYIGANRIGALPHGVSPSSRPWPVES